jgi:hypothetical protein
MRLFGINHHHCDDPLAGASPVEVECFYMLAYIIETQEKIMTDLTDLQSAVTDLTTELASNNAEIVTLLTKITTPGVSSADVQTAVAAIRVLITDNQKAVSDAQAAAP